MSAGAVKDPRMSAAVEAILNELREEAPATRRILERVPADKLAWKPHAKSRSLGELAWHIANIPGMARRIATTDEFTPGRGPKTEVTSAEQIREAFEKNLRDAEEVLGSLDEEKASGTWSLVANGKTIFGAPRKAMFRRLLLNHLYHHRGQLSVYLRLVETPVPMVYGPTADENPFV